MIWLGWITMRGDDTTIDAALQNPNRRTKLHGFADSVAGPSHYALCGVVRPLDGAHLGEIREGAKCKTCEKRCIR